MRLTLREVTGKDMDLLFRWANDPLTRQNAFQTEQIPYETHRAWFVRVLADRDVIMFVLCSENPSCEIGQIRMSVEDYEEEKLALIDYSIDPDMRGKGYGSKMILMAEECMRTERTDVVYCKAQVKYSNIASAKVFERCGYDREDKDDYIEFTKRIRGI